MHITKEQFGGIKHLIEERFGDSIEEEVIPHIRYDQKTGQSMQNGEIYVYQFKNKGKTFKVEIVEKEKMSEHEKVKDGKVTGRSFENVAGEFTYAMELYVNQDGSWQLVDLDVGDILSM